MQDYCVADYSKNPKKVTVNDFVYSKLAIPGNTYNINKVAVTPASSESFPGLNGMGLSMARLDWDMGGSTSLHTHKVTELATVVRGSIIAGFIASDNAPYYRILNKGDIMLFPPTLLHFQVNVGPTPAMAFSSFNSPKPGVQSVSRSLFGGDLSTWLVHKTVSLDEDPVKKLKKIFGGSH